MPKLPTWDDVKKVADDIEKKVQSAGATAREKWNTQLKPKLSEVQKNIEVTGQRAGEAVQTQVTALSEALSSSVTRSAKTSDRQEEDRRREDRRARGAARQCERRAEARRRKEVRIANASSRVGPVLASQAATAYSSRRVDHLSDGRASRPDGDAACSEAARRSGCPRRRSLQCGRASQRLPAGDVSAVRSRVAATAARDCASPRRRRVAYDGTLAASADRRASQRHA